MSGPATVTAAVLVIGDEILSGRTKDRNIGYIAEYLARLGVDVREARVVPDVEDEIVAALDALKGRYDYVVTTGGIGPTHDDITADAVARAFGVPIGEDPRAMAIMMERYLPDDLTPARRRMARIPEGAELVDNPISKAPGFRIGNVFVLAGVPSVMQAMLDSAVKSMKTGSVMLVETIEAGGGARGSLWRPARQDRGAAPGRLDRLLSLVQGRAVQQPDRRARQGQGRGRRRPRGGRGDARPVPERRQAALKLAAPIRRQMDASHAAGAGPPHRTHVLLIGENRAIFRRQRHCTLP